MRMGSVWDGDGVNRSIGALKKDVSCSNTRLKASSKQRAHRALSAACSNAAALSAAACSINADFSISAAWRGEG